MRHSRFLDDWGKKPSRKRAQFLFVCIKLVFFVGLMTACSSILYNAQTADTVTNDLAQMVSDELRDVTNGLGTLIFGCGLDNANPAAEDAYSAALPGALSHLLADPQTQTYDFDKLREIFRLGAPYTDVYFNPGAEETFIVSLKSFVCLANADRPENWEIYVMNRRGDSWHIGSTGGVASLKNFQWAEDRWVMLYSTPQRGSQISPGLWQVQPTQDGWAITSDFSLEGIVTRWPMLVLDDSYRRIRLNIRTYNPRLPLCQLDAELVEGADHFYYDIDTLFSWQGEQYILIDEVVTTVRIGHNQTDADILWTQLDGATLDCANLGAQAHLAQLIRDDIPLKPDSSNPQADPCLPDFNREIVDEYNEAHTRVLAKLIADPRAQLLGADDLAAAFNRVSEVRALVEGDDYFLVSMLAWTPQCAPGRHSISILNVYVMSRSGEIWPLVALHGAEGFAASIDAQWAGDRWIAVINNNGRTLCRFCYSIWQIKHEGDTWTNTSLLELGTAMDNGNQWVNTPQLTLLDGYRKIALNLSPDYIEPPCTFTPSIQPELYKIWREIRREYSWQPHGYQQTAETEIATHVVINAIDALGRRTYRQLEDWQAYCIQSSR